MNLMHREAEKLVRVVRLTAVLPQRRGGEMVPPDSRSQDHLMESGIMTDPGRSWSHSGNSAAAGVPSEQRAGGEWPGFSLPHAVLLPAPRIGPV